MNTADSWAEVHEHIRDELLGPRGNKQTGVGTVRRLARRAVMGCARGVTLVTLFCVVELHGWKTYTWVHLEIVDTSLTTGRKWKNSMQMKTAPSGNK